MHVRRLIRPLDYWADKDGRLRAPQGAPQYPTLLRGYKRRPPWKVAGVDYRVGPKQGSANKNPSGISMTGVSVAGGTVSVTGDSVTLDGYDFSGFDVSLTGNGTTISNSKFLNTAVFLPSGKSNVALRYCEIDGNASGEGSLIGGNGGGTYTIEYCWLHDASEDVFQTHQNTNATTIIRYNLLEDNGTDWSIGGHGDWLQMTGGPHRILILFNTGVQFIGLPTGFTEGWYMWGFATTDIVYGDAGYNTCRSDSDGMNSFFATGGADISGMVRVHDNYADSSAGFAPGGAGGGPSDAFAQTLYRNNVNMASGSAANND